MSTHMNSEANHYESRSERRSRRLGLTAPILLITLGVLFLVGQFIPDWGVEKTWPVILIISGLSKLIESAWAARSTSSH